MMPVIATITIALGCLEEFCLYNGVAEFYGFEIRMNSLSPSSIPEISLWVSLCENQDFQPLMCLLNNYEQTDLQVLKKCLNAMFGSINSLTSWMQFSFFLLSTSISLKLSNLVGDCLKSSCVSFLMSSLALTKHNSQNMSKFQKYH